MKFALVILGVVFSASVASAAETMGARSVGTQAGVANGGFGDLNPEMSEITDGIFEARLAYANADNFMQQAVYPAGFNKIYLHRDCKALLDKAAVELKRRNVTEKTDLRFVVYDALRPCLIQQKMFNIKPDPDFVANPGNCEDFTKVGQHNLGMAIDIGLAGADGKELDMGTGFDTFDVRSHIDNEGSLGEKARKNRKILRDVLTAAGLKPLRTEWWHFSCPKLPGKKYPIQK